MQLRTSEPFSLVANGLLNSYPSLRQDASSEIVVVGGGVTGALVSHALVERHQEVMLIDKRHLATGSTAASTGMLQYEIDVPMIRLADMIGLENAALCYRAGITAIHELENLVRENNLGCGFETKRSLYCARRRRDVSWLKDEFDMRHRFELGVKWLEKTELFNRYGIRCNGAIFSETAAQVDTYRLAHELIALNAGRGLRVYDHTPVSNFDLSGRNAKIHLENGATVTCGKIIFCTGYEAATLLNDAPAKLFYTYASVSEQGIQLPSALHDTIVWDTGDPYFYLRCTGDGRLLVGGEDTVNRAVLLNRSRSIKAKKLRARVTRLMPGVQYIEDFTWGGTFGATKDGLPYIGKSPRHPHALFVLAYGGNGITFSVQAMDMIVAELEGRQHPLAPLYRFGR